MLTGMYLCLVEPVAQQVHLVAEAGPLWVGNALNPERPATTGRQRETEDPQRAQPVLRKQRPAAAYHAAELTARIQGLILPQNQPQPLPAGRDPVQFCHGLLLGDRSAAEGRLPGRAAPKVVVKDE